MKVLKSIDGATILSFPTFTDGKIDGPEKAGFFGLNGKGYTEGVVAEVPDATVKMQATAATKLPVYKWSETSEFMRDLRWIAKRLIDVEAGAKITPAHTGRGYGLTVPKDARPNYTEGLAVGARVAVGPNVSPKALMNLHGEVVAMNGQKATVRLDAGDLDRVNRATGKNYAKDTRFHISTLEVIA